MESVLPPPLRTTSPADRLSVELGDDKSVRFGRGAGGNAFTGEEIGQYTFSGITDTFTTVVSLTKSANDYYGGYVEVVASAFRTGSGGDGRYLSFVYAKTSSSVGDFTIATVTESGVNNFIDLQTVQSVDSIAIQIKSATTSTIDGILTIRHMGGCRSSNQGMRLVDG